MDNSVANYLFHQGTNFKAYEYFGAHFEKRGKDKGVTFRVWANSAESVSVVGDFNSWNEQSNVMENIGNGVFELFIKGIKQFDAYKYAVKTSKGVTLKADPFAFHAETAPKTASKVYDIDGYKWLDGKYLKNRETAVNHHNRPINIYEVNLLSFMQKENGDYYSYRELADLLVPYVKTNGYNYVEFMPVTEYPFDGSWGYQVTGYFAVTSRLGTPNDLMYLIDCFHKENIGVILDWVPAHFPKDEHGLYEFDGAPLYENHGWDRIEHATWGTRRFDYGRTEVQSFLISSACFLFEKFHIDGIRVDAVASMLYLDYDKKPGEWIPNEYGDNKNLEAIAFLKKLNEAVHSLFPQAIMIAEESTSYNMITKPVADGGLGFDYKWNMGWMNDILSYVQLDPLYRKYDHNKLTFSLMYAFSEHYVLPISHDEVVHGKKSLLDKQFGSYEEKFSGVRAFMGYMMGHPGKKLMFMGQEFGQFKEWAYKEGLEFFLKDYEKHNKLSVFFKELNNFYLSEPCLYGDDDGWDGFEWLSADDSDRNVIAFERRYNGQKLVALINFSGGWYNYRLGVDNGEYEVVFNSSKIKYGGQGENKKRVYKIKKICANNKDNSIEVLLPALSFIYLKKR
ncbi:MAG: 1,4-alpha-glucan branching protein GlgB [Clostridiales bacterium]|nr:1,4-alpha-glucan branching protein GlgB [Clostridiales bacterium]